MSLVDEHALEDFVRRVAREEARPLFVSQRTCERVLGIAPRDFLHHAREHAFVSTKERRLVIAKTDDVAAWLDARLARAKQPSNVTPIDTALARVGARRVG